MYVTSVLGSGILITPGLAARIAGAGSVLAWVLMSIASYPFAYTFATLSSRRPASGGIYSFVTEAFGGKAGTAVAWLVVGWVVLGAPAAALAASSYLSYAFPMGKLESFLVAISLILLAAGVNYLGIRFSARVQLATVLLIVAILLLAILGSVPHVKAGNFSPLLPEGLASVGVASGLLVWSYLGYENVSNVAEEFKDPARDFHRSVVISVLIVGALYVAVSLVTVGTGVYLVGTGVTPFVDLLSNALGTWGGVTVSLLAVVFIFSTINAYTTGMSRVVYAASKEGNFLSGMATVEAGSGAPRRAILFLAGLIMASFAFYYALGITVQQGFLATSGAAILAYVVGSAAGIKLLKERGYRRLLPWASLAVSLGLIPFIGAYLVPSVVMAAVGLLIGSMAGKS